MHRIIAFTPTHHNRTMSPSSSYDLVEPHPHTATPNVHTARSGAGNLANTSSTTEGSNASGPASRHPALFKHGQLHFTSVRGGAGNLHHSSERAIFSFDEELEREMRQMQDLAPVCYVGRGGAGNRLHIDSLICHADASDTDSINSTSSTESESGPDALNRKLKKGWGKVVGIGHHVLG